MQQDKRDALKDVSRFLRDVYCWCDAEGGYSGPISITRGTVKAVRRCVDAVLAADAMGSDVVRVEEPYDGTYEYLSARPWLEAERGKFEREMVEGE